VYTAVLVFIFGGLSAYNPAFGIVSVGIVMFVCLMFWQGILLRFSAFPQKLFGLITVGISGFLVLLVIAQVILYALFPYSIGHFATFAVMFLLEIIVVVLLFVWWAQHKQIVMNITFGSPESKPLGRQIP
jgi:hypothetical protein